MLNKRTGYPFYQGALALRRIFIRFRKQRANDTQLSQECVGNACLGCKMAVFVCWHRLILLVIFSLCGCTSASSQLDMLLELPVADGAFDVDRRYLGSEVNQQLFYRVSKPYRSKDVLFLYQDHFAKLGWYRCKGEMEDWSSFIDRSKGVEKKVEQITHYWISPSEAMRATVVIRYEFDADGFEEAPAPDSAIQYIIVLMQKNLGNMRAELKDLNLKCSR